MKLKYYQDPGHGWVAVKRSLVESLGIADAITPYSYQNGQTVYLEEDLDADLLIKALTARGETVTFDVRHTNSHSSIRNYPHYAP